MQNVCVVAHYLCQSVAKARYDTQALGRAPPSDVPGFMSCAIHFLSRSCERFFKRISLPPPHTVVVQAAHQFRTFQKVEIRIDIKCLHYFFDAR